MGNKEVVSYIDANIMRERRYLAEIVEDEEGKKEEEGGKEERENKEREQLEKSVQIRFANYSMLVKQNEYS